MKAYDPQVITGVEGSHCLIQLYGWDMYIDAKKERPGYTRIVLYFDYAPTVTINSIEDEHAPGLDRFQPDRDVHQRKPEPPGNVGTGSPEGNRNRHRVLRRQGLGRGLHRIAD